MVFCIYLFIERIRRVCLRAFLCLTYDFRNMWKEATVMLQCRCALLCWVVQGALFCFQDEGWPRGTEGIWRGKGEASHDFTGTKHMRPWDRKIEIFWRKLGKWLKDSLRFRHFAFPWECVNAEERALQYKGSGRSSSRVVLNSAFWDAFV